MSNNANVWTPKSVTDISGDTKSVTQTFTVTIPQIEFKLSAFSYAVGTGALEIHKNGLLLAPETQWVETGPSTFLLIEEAQVGDIVVATGNIAISGTLTDVAITTTQLINASSELTLVETSGYTTSGDGGAGTWKLNGVTGQTVSQSPAQLVDGLLNDASGNQWKLTGSTINALSLGMESLAGDMTAEIKAAVKASAGKTLYIPAGVYSGKGSQILNISSPIKIIGEGMGQSILDLTFSSPLEAFTNVKLSASDITFQDFTVSSTGDVTSAVAMLFSTTDENLTFTRFEIDGSASFDAVATNLVQGIKVNDTASPSNVKFTDCKIHGVHFGLFTANGYTGVAENWSFKGCSFFDNTADDLEFNSDNRAIKNWQRVTIIGNFFTDHPSSTGNSFGVGTDSGQEIIIQGNHFKGYVGSGVHLEDELKNVIVNGNLFMDCKIGIECYNDVNSFVEITNNVLDGGAGHALLIDASTLADPDATLLNNSIGIIAQRPIAGTNTNCIVSGNIISQYDVGMSCPAGNTNSISNNTVALCSVAFNFSENGLYAFRDNKATRCKYVAWGAANSTVIESVAMDECPNILFGASPSFIVQGSITWSKLALGLATGVATEVPMFELPTKIHGDQARAVAIRDSLTSQLAASTSDLNYDGATLSAARTMSHTVGTISMSNPVFSDTGSILGVKVFHSVGSNQDFRVLVEMRSSFIFN